MRKPSRLSRKQESNTKRSIYISVIGIIFIVFLLAKFGIPFLVNTTLFIYGTNNSDSGTNSNKPNFVSSPVLDALPTATNSAEISVSGTALPNQTINLYINGQLLDKTEVKDNNTFIFDNVSLEKGENFIQAKAVLKKENKESDFSNSYTVIFKKDPPTLIVDSPTENQSFYKDEKHASVKGKTDPNVKVTINDLWAIVDSDGNFSYNLLLKNGENIIKIYATDEAGNKTSKEIKVSYSE